MSTASVTYGNFVNGTAAEADEIDQNFQDIVDYLNTECIVRDGSTAMTAALTTSGAPTSDLHAANKQYVDELVEGFATASLSYNNLTIGDATVTLRAQQVGEFYFFSARVQFGSTTSVTGSPIGIVMPKAAATVANHAWITQAWFWDGGGLGSIMGIGRIASASTTLELYFNEVGANGFTSSTEPFTFGANSEINVQGWYQVAAPV